jgi:hypothetical protein
MRPEYYIFKILPDGTPLWLEDAKDIGEATEIVFTLQQSSPGPYVLYDLRNPAAPAFELSHQQLAGHVVVESKRRGALS